MLPSSDPYELFERSAVRSPDRIALRIGEKEWTYRQLHHLALQYSAWCNTNCSGSRRIAVFGRKTVEAYAAILGILHSGRSYVPLHPDHPPARSVKMLRAAGIADGFVETSDMQKVDGIDGVTWCSDPGENASTATPANSDEAYVMFTSGSTGGPKGVPVGRAQVAAYLRHQLSTYQFSSEDRFTQFFALTFDLSVHDLFVCWAAGGMLCVQPDDQPLRSAAFAREQKISVWFSVPSQVNLLRRVRALEAGSLPDLRIAFFCGESLSAEVAASFQKAAPNCEVIDLYGPTETTIAVTAQRIDRKMIERGGPIPIGKPFTGHSAVVDLGDQLTPEGEGELLISGPQVNAGYLNDEETTGRAFIEHHDKIWYRTGDRARIDPDGMIHFIGRIDDQVKLMGHRVEPAEVDQVLAPVISPANCLTLVADLNGAKRLITFVDQEVGITSLFTLLRKELPHYMIPEKIITLDGFPYTSNGKVDRRALLEQLVRS